MLHEKVQRSSTSAAVAQVTMQPFDAGLFGVYRNRFIRDEVQIAFDGQTKRPLQHRDFCKADVTKFGRAEAEVAQPEQPIRMP